MPLFGKKKEEEPISANDVDDLSMKNVEASDKGQFKDFLKTVISFTGDLSSLTCPAFFLNGLSLLEYGTYWGDHPSLFTGIGKLESKEERLLAITRWFISTLYGSYASRCTNGQYEKKPYNPILGEKFICKLGDAQCICEQVCHHPPISAFYLEDEKAGVSLNGHSGQKSKFKGTSIKVEQVGRAVLYLKQFDEQYVIDFPDLLIRGFLTGGAYIELGGACTIIGSNDTKAVLDFVPKPWFGGEYNHIKGSLYSDKNLVYQVSGRWSHQSYYQSPQGEEKILLFDAEAEPMAERVTVPLEQQDDYETRKVWGPVTEALNQKNFKLANIEKTKIEDWQRGVRKERQENNQEWNPELFTFTKDIDQTDSTYHTRNVELKNKMDSKHQLDAGTWTYNKSLHLR